MFENLPILGVCGWSGSGKTTLLEAAIPELSRMGLRVAVLKHDAHGIDVDRPGKDSDRLFRAGADVALHGPQEGLLRLHGLGGSPLSEVLEFLALRHDLVLVEGHKNSPMEKIWLLAEDENKPPLEAGGVSAVLGREPGRLEAFLSLATEFVTQRLQEELGATDKEWKALGPKIEKVQTLSCLLGDDGAAGGMPGGGPGGIAGRARLMRNLDPNAQPSDIETKAQALQTLLDNKQAKPEAVTTALKAYRDARVKTQQDLAKARQELKDVLTVRQEAQLVTMGILE